MTEISFEGWYYGYYINHKPLFATVEEMMQDAFLAGSQAAQQLDGTVSGWTCDKCGTESNVGYRCSWCESPRRVCSTKTAK